MAKQKLTKHQKELLKKFGAFRKRQAAKRAELSHLREELKAAIAAITEKCESLSEGQRLLEAARLKRIAASASKKIG